MKRLVIFMLTGLLFCMGAAGKASHQPAGPANDREYWVNVMDRIARPVITALSEDRLRESIPVGRSEAALSSSREFITHMESVGRTIAGIAPWIELGPDDTP